MEDTIQEKSAIEEKLRIEEKSVLFIEAL